MTDASITEKVKNYYGEVLQSQHDLKTSACCPIDAMPSHLKPLMNSIHPEVKDRFYGCGSPIPHALEGKTLLDLGCGTGRDLYLAAQLVGPSGRLIGIDMTDEQLAVANAHKDYHLQQFGFTEDNIEFHHAQIEDLSSAGIEDNSVDVVISNCVINLSSNKENVFREIFRVLKPGGELYFSDVYADRRIPSELMHDPVLLGECLGGALYTEDFRRIMQRIGFLDFRTTSKGLIELHDEAIVEKVGMINFYSITVRAFKVDLEDVCENYGHVAFYKGTIKQSPHVFVLDDHHAFKTGMPVPVCGNTANMLAQTRYQSHFDVIGDFSRHYGFFDCGSDADDNQDAPCC